MHRKEKVTFAVFARVGFSEAAQAEAATHGATLIYGPVDKEQSEQ